MQHTYTLLKKIELGLIRSRSRLGCQVIASPKLDELRLALSAATHIFSIDGYIPKPH